MRTHAESEIEAIKAPVRHAQRVGQSVAPAYALALDERTFNSMGNLSESEVEGKGWR